MWVWVWERQCLHNTIPSPNLVSPRPPAAAAPGYQPAIVTAFYAPYLVVPLLLALHMAVSPRPFGARVPGAGGKPKRK